MNDQRATPAMKRRAAIWLLLALAVVASCIGQIVAAGRLPLQTNLLALLPPTERNPVAEEAIDRLADSAGGRVIILVGGKDSSQASAAAREFATELRQSDALKNIVAELPPFNPRQINDFYLPYRFNLLAAADRIALTAGHVDLGERLQRKLYTPFRAGLTLSPADDPFGFTDDWLATLPLNNFRLAPENGVLVTHEKGKQDNRTWVFVSAELPDSAYDGTLQQRVSDAVTRAEDSLKTKHAGIDILRMGTVFYASAARQSAEREFDLIGAGSLLGLLGLLYLVFRSLRPLALGLLSVGFGIGAAVALSIATFGELHLITLVFGASLIGEAIDYATQYFAAHLGAGKDWDAIAGLRRIAPGLAIALATSLLGYGALLPALLVRPGTRDPETAVAYPRKFLAGWQKHMNPRRCLILAGLLLVIAIPGWQRLEGNDDIRLLISRPASLVAQEEKIRELTGFANSSQFFLVEGDTVDAVLAREEQLAARLDHLVTQGGISAYQAISAFVPSPERQQANRKLWQDKFFADETGLRRLLAASELRDDIADRQIADFHASAGTTLTVDDWLRSPLSLPYRHLWLGKTPQGFATIVIPQGAANLDQLAKAADGLTGVALVDKAGSVSRLFHDYRRWGALWLLGAFALVLGVLSLRYGLRQAAVTLFPTVLAVAVSLGIFGYMHAPLTLFNLMALMLVLGVGVNYAIFLREGIRSDSKTAAATLAGVLLSAGTTLLSFGLLAFSSMPALSGFGLTLLVGVGIAVLLAPMVLSFSKGGTE